MTSKDYIGISIGTILLLLLLWVLLLFFSQDSKGSQSIEELCWTLNMEKWSLHSTLPMTCPETGITEQQFEKICSKLE